MVIHKRTRLTPIQREAICNAYFKERKRVCDLAREYHVSRPTIYKIINNLYCSYRLFIGNSTDSLNLFLANTSRMLQP